MSGTRLPWVLTLAGLAVAGATTAALATGSRSGLDDVSIVLAVTAYAAVGVAVELARPGHLVGRLMLVGAAAWGLGEAALGLGIAGLGDQPGSSAAAALAVLGTALRGAGWILLVVGLPMVFPDGRRPGRGPALLLGTCLVLLCLGMLLSPEPLETRLESVDNPWGLPESWQLLTDVLALGSTVVAFAALVVAVAILVRRWRVGDELQRQQVVLFGIAFAVPLLVLLVMATPVARPWMFALSTLPVPVAVADAMFRRRLYDVQLAVSRTLTYAALTVVLAGLYALVVGGVGVLLRDRGAAWLPWAAAGVVAVAFAPLRESLQRGVNRLTYGRWSTPGEVLADTGRRLADAADGGALLRSLTAEMVHGLGFRYAEIRDQSGRLLAADGADPSSTRPLEVLPLVAYGHTVGSLGWFGRPLRDSDLVLLRSLAHQIGGAVHTVALIEELRRAQEHLVLAREQERRRLRNDLHDGLGPSLAGLGFQLDAVQNLVDSGQAVDGRLMSLRSGLAETVSEVRRIVDGLRPPAVDELGLFGAVAELGQELAEGAGISLTLDLPRNGQVLPAAVEVAAYRVAQEALTNVVRHAGATHCFVTAVLEPDLLTLEVKDDGLGGARPASGVGLPGMRDRAREIGGRVDVTDLHPGTAVSLRLPLHAGATA